MSEVQIKGTTLHIFINGKCTAEPGIPLDNIGTRIPVGAVSIPLKFVGESKYVRIQPTKTLLEKKLKIAVYTLNFKPFPPHNCSPKLINPAEQNQGCQFGLVKLSLEEDKIIDTQDKKLINILIANDSRRKLSEGLFAIEKNTQRSIALQSGKRVELAYNGTEFTYCYL